MGRAIQIPEGALIGWQRMAGERIVGSQSTQINFLVCRQALHVYGPSNLHPLEFVIRESQPHFRMIIADDVGRPTSGWLHWYHGMRRKAFDFACRHTALGVGVDFLGPLRWRIAPTKHGCKNQSNKSRGHLYELTHSQAENGAVNLALR
jgi:hypothetical protein